MAHVRLSKVRDGPHVPGTHLGMGGTGPAQLERSVTDPNSPQKAGSASSHRVGDNFATSVICYLRLPIGAR